MINVCADCSLAQDTGVAVADDDVDRHTQVTKHQVERDVKGWDNATKKVIPK